MLLDESLHGEPVRRRQRLELEPSRGTLGMGPTASHGGGPRVDVHLEITQRTDPDRAPRVALVDEELIEPRDVDAEDAGTVRKKESEPQERDQEQPRDDVIDPPADERHGGDRAPANEPATGLEGERIVVLDEGDLPRITTEHQRLPLAALLVFDMKLPPRARGGSHRLAERAILRLLRGPRLRLFGGGSRRDHLRDLVGIDRRLAHGPRAYHVARAAGPMPLGPLGSRVSGNQTIPNDLTPLLLGDRNREAERNVLAVRAVLRDVRLAVVARHDHRVVDVAVGAAVRIPIRKQNIAEPRIPDVA